MPVDAKANSDEGMRRRLDVELCIIHPTMTPADITAALALETNVAHRVGDQRKTGEHSGKAKTTTRVQTLHLP